LAQSSQKSKASRGRITGIRWRIGCSAQCGRQAVFATFRIYVAKEAAQVCKWTPLALEKIN
jgi:hypothetical protein